MIRTREICLNHALVLEISLVFLVYCACIKTTIHAQDGLKEEADSLLVVLRKESGHAGPAKTLKIYRSHLQPIRYHDKVFPEFMQFLFTERGEDVAAKVLSYNPFLVSQHEKRAYYFYYRAIAQMLSDRGWPAYKEAEKSLNSASREIRLAMAPDYGFVSDIENARGYLSITARGESTDEVGDLVCIVRYEFIEMAIDHFRAALTYNPDNQVAQQNLDTLMLKLQQANLPIPPVKYDIPSRHFVPVNWDSLNIDSLSSTDNLPVLDYSLLPRNYSLIISEIEQYDEIMLLIDLSGSMDEAVGWQLETSRFRVAQQLALFIAVHLRRQAMLGALSVGQDCDTTSMVLYHPIAKVSREELIMRIDAIRPYGHTPLDQRLKMTARMFSQRRNRKLVFLLSDGMDTCGDNPDLCHTARMLAAQDIDLSVFSFIYETLDPESRSAYSIYNCMTQPSEGKVYKISKDGGIQDEIDYEPVSLNLLRLPVMDTSLLWRNNEGLYHFPIDNVVPVLEEIHEFGKQP